ncbi:hypothetical protein KEM55_006306 [Ascosphaera atra]|nr:hypothetical protein KEM55_006306 [Ascosphaera atra]
MPGAGRGGWRRGAGPLAGTSPFHLLDLLFASETLLVAAVAALSEGGDFFGDRGAHLRWDVGELFVDAKGYGDDFCVIFLVG